MSLNDIFFWNTNKGWAVGEAGTILYKGPPLDVNETIDLEQTITVYPNPSHSILNIEYPQELDVTGICLFDNLGRKAIQFKEKETTLNVEELEHGLYYLTISTTKGEINKTILIK